MNHLLTANQEEQPPLNASRPPPSSRVPDHPPSLPGTSDHTPALSTKPICPDCHRPLSTEASLERHRENYWRYRQGKRARKPAVGRHSNDVVLNDEAFRVRIPTSPELTVL